MPMIKRYKLLAQQLKWLRDCKRQYREIAQDRIDTIMASAPSGSGIDHGTKISYEASKDGKIVFDFSYHHMNEHGYYDGWTEHTLVVTASLEYGLNILIKGRDRNQIKDYLYEVYGFWLDEDIDEDAIRRIGSPCLEPEEHVTETNVIS